MSELERTLRTGARMRLRADSMLTAALLSELMSPGDAVWVVSGWLTDVEVVDDTLGAFDAILGETPPTTCRLSEMLALIAEAGARIHVVTRPGTHNEEFTGRLRAAIQDQQRLHLILDPSVHEKTVCGRNWILTGSMNFTVSELGSNEESVTYKVDGRDVAQAQLDFEERWGSGP
jgi:PLD-like domain